MADEPKDPKEHPAPEKGRPEEDPNRSGEVEEGGKGAGRKNPTQKPPDEQRHWPDPKEGADPTGRS